MLMNITEALTSKVFANKKNRNPLQSRFQLGLELLEDRIMLAAPAFDKVFQLDTIGPGSVTTLTFTIDNSVNTTEGASDLAFVDSLPAGLTIAAVPNLTVNNIANADISAPANGGTIALSDGQIAQGAIGTFSVDVTAASPSTYMNTTSPLSSTVGTTPETTGPASDDLIVDANLPGFTKSFSASTVGLGGRSTLTFTIDNDINDSPVDNLIFTDNLPTGMVIADPVNLVITDIGTSAIPATVTAIAGSNVITLDATGTAGFPAIAAGTTGIISVDVIANSVGVLGNTSGDLLADGVAAGKAANTLDVVAPAAIHAVTSFTDDPVPPDGVVNARIVLTNFNRDSAATDIDFELDLETGLTGLAPDASIMLPATALGGTLDFSGGVLTLTGATLSPGQIGTIDVPLLVPALTTPGTFNFEANNTLSATIDGGTVTGTPVSDILQVAAVPTLQLDYLTDPVAAGDTADLKITITNTSTDFEANDVAFDVVFPDIIQSAVAASIPANGFMGPGSSAFFIPPSSSESARLVVSGGTIAIDDTFMFTITVNINNDAASGIYTTTTNEVTATIDGTTETGNATTDDLTVVGAPLVSMEVTDDPVKPGDTATLSITVEHPVGEAAGITDATDIAFTIDLDAALAGLTATGLPLLDPVGSGSTLTGSAGDTFLTLSGGTLAPGGSATFEVTLQVPSNAPLVTHTIASSPITATVNGLSTTGNPASTDLQVTSVTFSMSFEDNDPIPGNTVTQGETVTLTYSFTNDDPTFDATGVFFTHDLTQTLGGLVFLPGTLSPSPPLGTGTASFFSGDAFLSISGGTIPAGSTVGFSIDLQVPGTAVADDYGSLTSSYSGSIDGNGFTGDPAFDTLTVEETVLIQKEFIDGDAAPGSETRIKYTLTNNSTRDALSAIAFTDGLGTALPGLAATGFSGVPAGWSVSGTSTITLTGGSLAIGETAMFVVTAVVPSGAAAGAYPGTTSDVTGDVGGLPFTSSGVPATLVVVNNPDFGDAPNTYSTTLEFGGPTHVASGPRLGLLRDTEVNAQGPLDGTGDDVNDLVDEDGVTLPQIVRGQTATFVVNASAAGKLDAFIDFNRDGKFDGVGEKFSMDVVMGDNPLVVPIPANATLGSSYARFRISTAGGLSFDGPANNGEVEDYAIEIQEQGTISGNKWEDVNGNGMFDVGEPFRRNWEILVYADSDGNGQLSQAEFDAGAVASALTMPGSGAYSFTLNPGNYIVVESSAGRGGWFQSFPTVSVTSVAGLFSNGHAVVLESGEADSGNNFLNFRQGRISGRKFEDLNGNGKFDPGESNLAGWEIRAYADVNGDGLLSQAEANAGPAATATTNSGNGFYNLKLNPGKYVVVEVSQPQWFQSFPGTKVTNVAGLGSKGHAIELLSREKNRPNHFFNFRQGQIRGRKFNDIDGNGTVNSGEPNLAGWEIRAYKDGNGDGILGPNEANRGPVATALTASGNGFYALTVNPGKYIVVEVSQPTWLQTFPTNQVTSVSGLEPGGYAIEVTSNSVSDARHFLNFQELM